MSTTAQDDLPQAEFPAFLTDQLITSIGNKRSLLREIERAVVRVRAELGGRRLRVLDAFSGSGAVSRLLKSHADLLVANDIEDYARVLSHCFLANADAADLDSIAAIARELNQRADEGAFVEGFIERLYAPGDDNHILPGERVFYTRDNARRLDLFASALQRIDEPSRTLLLGPLLSAASVHANTAGVFKGFYKDRTTGIGRFGGTGGDALRRITGTIQLRSPVLSAFSCETIVRQVDANALDTGLWDLDLVYIDPPYNQHPYGSNYFMLNLLVDYREPQSLSPISGIPGGWRRSAYNAKQLAFPTLSALLARLDARYILLSFNSEGFIAPGDLRRLLDDIGTVTEFTVPYPTFRGSRNLRGRSTQVTEHLYLVRRW